MFHCNKVAPVSVILILMVATGSSSLVSAGNHASQPSPVPLYRGDQIEASFLLPDRLLLWIPQPLLYDTHTLEWLETLGEDRKWRSLMIWFPLKTWSRLALEVNGQTRVISWPSDLRGEVSLTTEAEALAFLRLFTSVDTYYRFPRLNRVEITSLEPNEHDKLASIPREKAQKFKLPDTAIFDTELGYRVFRVLAARLETGDILVGIVQEAVGDDGAYELLVLWTATIKEEELGIKHFPVILRGPERGRF